MYDPNLQDFYQRVGRVQAARAKGYGMEAPGTLGRSFYYRPKKKSRIGMILPMLFVAVCGFGMKGTIHYYVGDRTYEDRVATLVQGEGFDRLGGVLMTADPVTLWVSGTMRKHLATRGIAKPVDI